MGCSHYEIKVSYKIIDALVLAINKATFYIAKQVKKKVKEVKFVLQVSCKLLQM